MRKSLNPTLVYVLSILGLLCCCFAGTGVFLSGAAYFIANGKIKGAQLNPEEYDGKISAMETAKIIALIITIINILNLIYTIYTVYTTGWDTIQEQWNEALKGYEAAQQAQ